MASVIGLGFVGSAVTKSFKLNNVSPLYGYDKYKDGGVGCFDDCLRTPIIFLSLPTPYDEHLGGYDKTSIEETLAHLHDKRYAGVVVLKSTVEPGMTEEYSVLFPTLSICHNPEFLSAATAFEDFHEQKHVVIGKGSNCSESQIEKVRTFFQVHYPQADVSVCCSTESESMKSFVNCFYSVKIQFFNELYLSCQQMQLNFGRVKDLMLKNGWINPMHTSVPGHDNKLSYGGSCFPKDTNALLQHMKRKGTPHAVLEGCVTERDKMRDDGINCIAKSVSKHFKKEKTLNGYCNGQNGHNGHVTNGYVTNGHH